MDMTKILTFGEALIDMLPLDDTNTVYEKCAGGAPANVAVGIAKLGGNAAFMTTVGNDANGRFLTDTCASYGVDTTSMHTTDKAHTGMAFVTLENGERSFDFIVQPSADQFLSVATVREAKAAFDGVTIFHYGSLSCTQKSTKQATITAIKQAKAQGALISYDPNLRLNLWPNEALARETILDMWQYADIVKISEEEHAFLGELPTCKLLVITQGEKGCIVQTAARSFHVPSHAASVVDTTGAGDAFVAAMLQSIVEQRSLEEIFARANKAGAMAVTRKGAMTGLPTAEEL